MNNTEDTEESLVILPGKTALGSHPQIDPKSSASSVLWFGLDLQQLKKKPTGCLLGACSGQHPMGYRFSLLTLLFSGVCRKIKHRNAAKFGLFL